MSKAAAEAAAFGILFAYGCFTLIASLAPVVLVILAIIWLVRHM